MSQQHTLEKLSHLPFLMVKFPNKKLNEIYDGFLKIFVWLVRSCICILFILDDTQTLDTVGKFQLVL